MSTDLEVGTGARTEKEIQEWVTDRLARELSIDPATINIKTPFTRYGVDSIAAVNLVSDLEQWLGTDLSPTLPYEYSTVEALSRHLVSGANDGN